jgi:predicted dehydrogenase
MAQTIKIGMVGLDTSHCPAFAGLLNDERKEYHVAGGRVVAAYPGGSDQFSNSRNRVAGYTEQLRDEYGVEIVDSIPALVEKVDAIMLESVDGRQHLEQFEQMAVGKPVYIDKPFTTSTADAQALVDLARETGTPIMSCSSLRYAAGIVGLDEGEAVVSCEAFGPAALLDDYPGLFWYGIHSAEMLFSFMGTGCKQVRCMHYEDMDVAVGEWADGRLGVMRGTRFGKYTFGCLVHTDQATRAGMAQSTPPYYYLLLQKILPFFETGESPIDIRETLEIVAFLEAADESRAQGGEVISLAK